MNAPFHPVELAILADYLGLPRPEEAKPIDLGAHWGDGEGSWTGLRRSPGGGHEYALENAVARILLRSIQLRLPHCGIVVGDDVYITRKIERLAHERGVALMPQLLLEINWASTGPGFDWSEAYYLAWVPGFDRYVVTSSLDSEEGPTGYQDVALGHFGAGVELHDAVRQIVEGYWRANFTHSGIPEERWEEYLCGGLVSEEEATTWAEAIWPTEIDEDEGDLEDEAPPGWESARAQSDPAAAVPGAAAAGAVRRDGVTTPG
jgi:hypothetical protein